MAGASKSHFAGSLTHSVHLTSNRKKLVFLSSMLLFKKNIYILIHDYEMIKNYDRTYV